MTDYLEQFDPADRREVEEFFHRAHGVHSYARGLGSGYQTLAAGPKEMKRRVVETCEARLEWVPEGPRRTLYSQIVETVEQSTELCRRVHEEEEERRKRIEEHDDRLSGPATEGQLNFLRTLGCKEPPAYKAAASRKIEELLTNERNNRGPRLPGHKGIQAGQGRSVRFRTRPPGRGENKAVE